jgi:hypothetical protein
MAEAMAMIMKMTQVLAGVLASSLVRVLVLIPTTHQLA